MKKLILILLVILPVAIIALTAFSAATILAEILYYPVESIEIAYDKIQTSIGGVSPTQKYFYMHRRDELDLKPFITVYPERAKVESLYFESDNPEIVSVENVVIKVHQNLRISSGTEITIDIRKSQVEEILDTIYIRIVYQEGDPLDYLGFHLDNIAKDASLGKYCQIVDDKLYVNRDILNDSFAKSNFNLGLALDIGPKRITELDYPDVIEKMKGLSWEVGGDDGVMELNPDGFTFTIFGTGQVTVTAKFKLGDIEKQASLTIEVS